MLAKPVFGEPSRELKIKAAVAFYIAKFVSWPDLGGTEAARRERTSLRLCTFGHSDINDAVHHTFDGKTINQLPVNVLELKPDGDLIQNRCDLVFVGGEQFSMVKSRLEVAANLPILTICDRDEISWGTCIAQIYPENNKAKIAFDKLIAIRAGLRVSSELLALSVVRDITNKDTVNDVTVREPNRR